MNILLTSATGYPSPDTGGPNKIIYYLLKGIDSDKNNVDYISKHYQLNSLHQHRQGFRVNNINYLREKLYSNSRFYRNIVTHPVYLQYHFNNLKFFFHSKFNILSEYDCINSHDIISGYYLRDYEKKKILTIHSKGSMCDVTKRYNSIKIIS